MVLTLRGEFDVSIAVADVRALIAPAGSGSRIVVDLAELTFMDCGSLRELASMRTQARRAGGDLVVAGPQPIVLRLLSLTGMISQHQVFASLDDAVGAAGSASAVSITPDATGRITASPPGSGKQLAG